MHQLLSNGFGRSCEGHFVMYLLSLTNQINIFVTFIDFIGKSHQHFLHFYFLKVINKSQGKYIC